MKENIVGTAVVEAAIQIHRELGPGLLETVYEVVLAHELQERGFKVRRQVSIPLHYRGIDFDMAFKADLIVEDLVVLELKSVESINNAHLKQLQTYLKVTNL